MTINAPLSIFKLCQKQFSKAILTDKDAVITISIDTALDEYEFTLTVDTKGIAIIKGGSDQAALWGYYEYLARFYGYIWQTPDKTIKYDIPQVPFKKIAVCWKHPYTFCWFHRTIPAKWREFLKIHRCIDKRDPKKFAIGYGADWYEKYIDTKPQIFARNPNGKVVNDSSLKFRLDNPDYIELVVDAIEEQLLTDPTLKHSCILFNDGVCWDSDCIPGRKPIDTWRGGTNLTGYVLDHYAAVRQGLKDRGINVELDTYVYGKYKLWPTDRNGFDGSGINAFFVDSKDIATYIDWKVNGFNMYWRPNLGYDCCDLSTEKEAIKIADMFMRFKSVGMNGFMFDINLKKASFDEISFFIYLIVRQIYSNAQITKLIEEFKTQ